MEVNINMQIFKIFLLMVLITINVQANPLVMMRNDQKDNKASNTLYVGSPPKLISTLLPEKKEPVEDSSDQRQNASEPLEFSLKPEKKKSTDDYYDQRQNGTENYRVKVDGLVFILAPADTLLLAGAALEPNFTSSLVSDLNNRPKPKPEKEEAIKPKPEIDNQPKSVQHESVHGHKPGLRITSLLAPFLNRMRHAQMVKK